MEMVMEHGMTQQAQAKKRAPRLEVTNPNAAGIDIGSASHYLIRNLPQRGSPRELVTH